MPAPQQAMLMGSSVAPLAATIVAHSYPRSLGTPAGVRFQADGQVWARQNSGGAYAYAYDWLTGSGDGTDYEIRATLSSGSIPTSGTMSTWQALSANRTWERTSSGWVTYTSNILFEIRDAVSLTVLASNIVTLEAYYGTGLPP